jgi:hypothetical protein
MLGDGPSSSDRGARDRTVRGRHAARRLQWKRWRPTLAILAAAPVLLGGTAIASSLGDAVQYTVAAPVTVQALGTSTTNATAGQAVTAGAKVVAERERTLDYAVLAVRDPAGRNVDFPGTRNWQLGTTQKVYTSTRTFTAPGTYTYWFAYLQGTRWFELSPRRTFSVVASDQTPSPSPTPSNPSASPTPSPTPTGPVAWPGPNNTGVPAGWTPARTYTSDVTITTPGAVVQDIRIDNASLVIAANNVTVRRVEVRGGRIDNWRGGACRNGLLLEDVSVVRAPGQVTSGNEPGIQHGGYTARRVKIDGLPEGFRVGGRSGGCGPVTIENSFARPTAPDVCGDWHGDGIQGYDGPALTVRKTTLELVQRTNCGGTAPFFYPSGQGNTSATIDGLLVKGGGFSFRLGMPGTVKGLRIAQGEWFYGPIDVNCAALSGWEATIVAVDTNYQPTSTVRSQPCNTSGGA